MNKKASLTVASIQLNSQQDVPDNQRRIEKWIAQAAALGAQMVVLPENAFCHPYSSTCQPALDSVPAWLQQQARQHTLWIFGGTVPARASNGKVYSRLHVINSDGEVVAHYDKIHLFDVHVEEEKADYLESATFEAGKKPLVVETPWGGIGCAICYDLRFPELILAMEPSAPVAVVVPAAFTLHTGRKHWLHLLRARALDTFSWIISAGQTGVHHGGRETFGHSAIVDPNGVVVAELAQGEGVILHKLDLNQGLALRRQIPLASHRRL